MVAICRHKCHIHGYRIKGLLKPTLPLPFAIVGVTIFYEVTRETAEPRFGHRFHYSLRTTAGLVNIYLILDVAIRHDDKRILALICILRTETTDRAPMSVVSATPGICCSGCEVLGQCLMTNVLVSHAGIDAGQINNIPCLAAVA